MLDYDEQAGIIIWKTVYYGPAMSGKTTNLLSLHGLIGESKRGQMMQADAKQQDRPLFSDLIPLAYRSKTGARLKIKIITIPGQVQCNTEKEITQRWARSGIPGFLASALYDKDVMETFWQTITDVHKWMDEHLRINGRFGIRLDKLIAYLKGEDISTQIDENRLSGLSLARS
jgi:hypothetical protein